MKINSFFFFFIFTEIFVLLAGSLGCGIGYGYLHRIPIRVLPDEKAASTATPAVNKPFLGTAPSPISVPYVPPLANTFAPNVNTIPMVPNTGKSDAEIVFAGVSNLNLNNSIASNVPSNLGTEQQPTELNVTPTSQPIEVKPVAIEQSQLNSSTNTTLPPTTNYQHAPIFASVPPTNIPSLNESFNIPTSINANNVPASMYQSSPAQGN